MKDNKIESLETLRGIAFSGIFLLHIGFPIQWATLGVSIFFVLSGFLLTYHYLDSLLAWGGYRNGLKFSVKRVSKIYPLHFITMILAVAMILVPYIGKPALRRDWLGLGRNIILNTFLLQSWYPDAGVNVSLNGVAWYLSAAAFHYFMFPYIVEKMRKLRGKRNYQYTIIILILILQLILSAIALKIDSSWEFYRWIAYDMPFFRMGDFLVGCIVGVMYLEKKDTLKSVKASIVEVIVLIACIGITFWDNKSEHTGFISKIFNNWTTIYIPVVAAAVYLFAAKQGMIVKTLSKGKSIKHIGIKSSGYFLIHYIVIQYMNRIVIHMPFQVSNLTIGLSELVLTIIFFEIYHKIEPRLLQMNCIAIKK
ncbi:MAG: acyltransferase [Hungatella sp.]|nr:acyltransferase [Hungatella sp.]